ncbi:MAG: TetR/AcrR family transcriptional regulator [Ignavibacteriae bacterium]|nr:MAG: TetR/AcrR family transcriptional regulator [Ignavibacteriota bacterium]
MKNDINPEREKIIIHSHRKFVESGFYKVTVDEIARELFISKNTIYKYFPTKDELVKGVIFGIMHSTKDKVEQIISSDTNAVDKMLKILDLLSSTVLKFSDKFLKDIQIHSPQIWEEIDSARKRIMTKNIGSIIQQGKKEEYFKDYPIEIITSVIIASIRSVVNPEFLLNVKYTSQEVFFITFEILLRGIMTDKGTKTLNKLKLIR